MKGNVYTRQKCSVCNARLVHVEKKVADGAVAAHLAYIGQVGRGECLDHRAAGAREPGELCLVVGVLERVRHLAPVIEYALALGEETKTSVRQGFDEGTFRFQVKVLDALRVPGCAHHVSAGGEGGIGGRDRAVELDQRPDDPVARPSGHLDAFGHGANFQRKGRFEQADGGTLFLDEIGDLSRSFSWVLQQLGEYNAYLRSLASKLSHELRTPLAIVTSSLENLEHEGLEGAPADYTARARDGAERLRRILNAMSEASRLEASIGVAEWESVDLAGLVGRSISRPLTRLQDPGQPPTGFPRPVQPARRSVAGRR